MPVDSKVEDKDTITVGTNNEQETAEQVKSQDNDVNPMSNTSLSRSETKLHTRDGDSNKQEERSMFSESHKPSTVTSMFSRSEKENKVSDGPTRSKSMFSSSEKEDKPTVSRSNSMFSRDDTEYQRSESMFSQSYCMLSKNEQRPPSRSMFSRLEDGEPQRPGSIFSRRDTEQSTISVATTTKSEKDQVEDDDAEESENQEQSAYSGRSERQSEASSETSNKYKSEVNRQALYKRSSNLDGWKPSNGKCIYI